MHDTSRDGVVSLRSPSHTVSIPESRDAYGSGTYRGACDGRTILFTEPQNASPPVEDRRVAV